MDRRGTKLLGFFALSLLIGSASLAVEPGRLLRAIAWLDSTPDAQMEALGETVVLDIAPAVKNDPRFTAGRAIFQTPNLLGGQAAKAGLSCESCHSGGTTNPHFHFPNMSDAPGTADVTHSFFSRLRGNRKFDPVPIPDLTKPGKVSHEGRALEYFIRGLIVEEFDGQEPDDTTLEVLSFYVRSLQGAKKLSPKPMTVDDTLGNVRNAISSAKSAALVNEIGIAKLLLAAARQQLGLIHERYPGRRLARHREALVEASQALAPFQTMLEENPERVSSALLRWDKLFHTKREAIKRDAEKSLYNPERLKTALETDL